MMIIAIRKLGVNPCKNQPKILCGGGGGGGGNGGCWE